MISSVFSFPLREDLVTGAPFSGVELAFIAFAGDEGFFPPDENASRGLIDFCLFRRETTRVKPSVIGEVIWSAERKQNVAGARGKIACKKVDGESSEGSRSCIFTTTGREICFRDFFRDSRKSSSDGLFSFKDMSSLNEHGCHLLARSQS